MSAAGRPIPCADFETAVNTYLSHLDDKTHNILGPCGEGKAGCGCGTSPGGHKKVDLIILIDSSQSMAETARLLPAAVEVAIKIASKECPSDLRVSWLVVDGAKPGAAPGGADPAGYLGEITPALAGTQFTQSHQQYLEAHGVKGPFEQDAPQPTGAAVRPGEEGADAVADLSRFYDWREGACRSIFYIGDSPLDGEGKASDVAAANASAVAVANGVVVSAYEVLPKKVGSSPFGAAYDAMTNPTGGSAWHGPVDPGRLTELIRDAICKACGGCRSVKLPEMKPCITMRWGASACDCFETDDTETVYISICNCYSNIAFTNVHIAYLTVTMDDGSPVPVLPDGTASVQIIPMGPICFGDIAPCVEGAENCVTRQVVVRSRGARGGRYRIQLYGVCYEVKIAMNRNECFVLNLCQD
ncbi:MAG: hypothetical protein V4574_12320 [Pseudomonadota bacterium]